MVNDKQELRQLDFVIMAFAAASDDLSFFSAWWYQPDQTVQQQYFHWLILDLFQLFIT